MLACALCVLKSVSNQRVMVSAVRFQLVYIVLCFCLHMLLLHATSLCGKTLHNLLSRCCFFVYFWVPFRSAILMLYQSQLIIIQPSYQYWERLEEDGVSSFCVGHAHHMVMLRVEHVILWQIANTSLKKYYMFF